MTHWSWGNEYCILLLFLEEDLGQQTVPTTFTVTEDIFLTSALNLPQLPAQWQALILVLKKLFPAHCNHVTTAMVNPQFARGLLRRMQPGLTLTSAIQQGQKECHTRLIAKLQQCLRTKYYNIAEWILNMNKFTGNHIHFISLCWCSSICLMKISFVRFIQAKNKIKGKGLKG